MTTNKNVEEILKEFEELVMSFLVQQLAWEKNKDSKVLKEMAEKRLVELKSFLLHAHNEGIKVGLEKVVEVAKRQKQELPKGKCLNAENHLFGSCFQCEKIKGNNQAIDDLTSLLTQLITSNNEVK